MTPQIKNMDTINVASFGATAPSGYQQSDKITTGDALLYELYLIINHVITIGTGATAATDGELLLEDTIYFETDKHGTIIDGLDGLGAHRLQQFQQGTRPQTTAFAAASATYSTAIRLPFAMTNGYRPYDTAIDLFRARPVVKIGLTALDKALGSVGTATDAPVIDVSGRIHYSPIPKQFADGGDLPEFMPFFTMKKYPVTSSTNGDKIQLPYGDRDYLYIAVSQRNNSTYAELSTVVTASQRMTLDVNGVNWFEKMALREIQGINKSTYSLETMPTGWAVLDFWSKSGRLADVVPTRGKQGNLFLTVDDTSVTNGALWIYSACVKEIPAGARR